MTASPAPPLDGPMLLDGGLATELERRGHDLNHPLWSARLLLAQPAAIGEVHRAYFEAGAECVISASYQASIGGLVREGLTPSQSRDVLRRSVRIACEARDQFLAEHPSRRALVAASIGPYGAHLADGSEYVGDYDVPDSQLRDFHQSRWEILGTAGADLLACETIPSLREAEVLRDLLEESPTLPAWVSFSCRDDAHVSDGTPLSRCAALFDGCPHVIAVGVNCTGPQHVSSLIRRARAAAPRQRIVVYPNSGQAYDAVSKEWTGAPQQRLGELARQWRREGATLIGGCCGTGPPDIRDMSGALSRE